ncbi:amino acid ABC transporter substrate-binding protein [Rhodopila sp.]|uniref:amino acid ABC transporter substrate-binding protein n=1 Tax=Rhodopila sp. TaxID=2480087 RepID=UPI003D150CC5
MRGAWACVWLCGFVLAAATTVFAQGGGPPASSSPTLQAVRARGALLCGTGGEIPGFSMIDSGGIMRGIDADYCRAVAAATLGDANKVKWVSLTAQNRFTALQSGEVDLLVRNTGWSLTRESSLGLEFAGVNFWDGTSIIVKTASGVKSVKQLGGASICVLPGTSTELDLADWARSENIAYTPVLIGSLSEIRQAFLSGRCDAYTSDSSQLAGFRYMQGAKAGELTILPEAIGIGPSGAMVRKGDDKWFDIVRWTHFATVVAESLGVSSTNIDSFKDTKNPDIRRLLGLESNLGRSLGLDDAWAARIIRQVGNYGELWQHDITPLGLDRGRNALWTKGGLQFAPQLR